jgi:hypothetical protein
MALRATSEEREAKQERKRQQRDPLARNFVARLGLGERIGERRPST